MNIDDVLTPEWIEECEGIYGAYAVKDVGVYTLDGKLVADDIFALLVSHAVLLLALEGFEVAQNCIQELLTDEGHVLASCPYDAEDHPSHADWCPYAIRDQIIKRAGG